MDEHSNAFTLWDFEEVKNQQINESSFRAQSILSDAEMVCLVSKDQSLGNVSLNRFATVTHADILQLFRLNWCVSLRFHDSLRLTH